MPEGGREVFYFTVLSLLVVSETYNPSVGSVDFFQEKGDGLCLFLTSAVTLCSRACRRNGTLRVVFVTVSGYVSKDVLKAVRGGYGYLAG